MKRGICTLSMLLFAGAVTAMAQPPAGAGGQGERGGPPGGGPGAGGRPPSPVVEALDADRDGVISAEELKNAATSLAALDKNKDGKLSEDELRPQGPGRPGAGAPGAGAPGAGQTGGPGSRVGQRAPGGARGTENGQTRGPGGGAGGPGGGQGMGPNPERMLTHALQFDANKDGALNKEELQKFFEEFAKGPPGAGGPGGSGVPGGGTRLK